MSLRHCGVRNKHLGAVGLNDDLSGGSDHGLGDLTVGHHRVLLPVDWELGIVLLVL